MSSPAKTYDEIKPIPFQLSPDMEAFSQTGFLLQS
jgi:hypothetical protein